MTFFEKTLEEFLKNKEKQGVLKHVRATIDDMYGYFKYEWGIRSKCFDKLNFITRSVVLIRIYRKDNRPIKSIFAFVENKPKLRKKCLAFNKIYPKLIIENCNIDYINLVEIKDYIKNGLYRDHEIFSSLYIKNIHENEKFRRSITKYDTNSVTNMNYELNNSNIFEKIIFSNKKSFYKNNKAYLRDKSELVILEKIYRLFLKSKKYSKNVLKKSTENRHISFHIDINDKLYKEIFKSAVHAYTGKSSSITDSDISLLLNNDMAFSMFLSIHSRSFITHLFKLLLHMNATRHSMKLENSDINRKNETSIKREAVKSYFTELAGSVVFSIPINNIFFIPKLVEELENILNGSIFTMEVITGNIDIDLEQSKILMDNYSHFMNNDRRQKASIFHIVPVISMDNEIDYDTYLLYFPRNTINNKSVMEIMKTYSCDSSIMKYARYAYIKIDKSLLLNENFMEDMKIIKHLYNNTNNNKLKLEVKLPYEKKYTDDNSPVYPCTKIQLAMDEVDSYNHPIWE